MDRKIILWALFILSLTSCNTSLTHSPVPSKTPTQTRISATLTPTVGTARSVMLTSEALPLRHLGFLSGFPCMAPCFLGITPGETPIDNVKDIVDVHLDQPLCTGSPDNVIRCSQSGYVFMRTTSNPSTGLVDGIGYYPSPSIFLKDIIEHYGEPDYVNTWVADDELIFTQATLLYDTFQTVIVLDELYGEKNNEISGENVVEEIFFLDKKTYLEDSSSLDKHSWKGYGIYP